MTPAEVAQWWRRGWQDAVRGFLAPDGKLSPIRQSAWEDGHARGKEAAYYDEARTVEDAAEDIERGAHVGAAGERP